MDRYKKYNRSEKGKLRYNRYRQRHWMRVEEARLAWNQLRRQRRLSELHAED
jgi:hypothetical protein